MGGDLWVTKNIFLAVVLINLSFLFVGCVSEDPRVRADTLATRAGLISENLQTKNFTIRSWSRITPPVHSLRVYIEGDGFAWKSRTLPSDNPTPRNPLGLAMAASDIHVNVLYLARPCQFVTPLPSHCSVNWWTNDRFSPDVIGAMNDALDQIVKRFPGVTLEMVGYSGVGISRLYSPNGAVMCARCVPLQAIWTLRMSTRSIMSPQCQRLLALSIRLPHFARLRKYITPVKKTTPFRPLLLGAFSRRLVENVPRLMLSVGCRMDRTGRRSGHNC